MAALARNAFAAMQQGKSGVRILSELLAYFTVTGLAGLRPDKIGGIGGAGLLDVGLLLIWGRLFLIGCRSIRRHGFPEAEQRYDERHTKEQSPHASLRKRGLQIYSEYLFRAHFGQTSGKILSVFRIRRTHQQNAFRLAGFMLGKATFLWRYPNVFGASALTNANDARSLQQGIANVDCMSRQQM
jgi:hypothetical protein